MPRITAATDHTLKASPVTTPAMTNHTIVNPLWVSVSEAAKLGGVQSKTIRRAIGGQLITYRIRGNRYLIDLGSLLAFLRSRTKLHNKLTKAGLGQYVSGWVE
ncbi:MAG TPA: helix-turn-helix domain-containing protein [bacterium]|jgi:hypothetical protein|nr:helix-turn-helix domain-containing protein [bacterium]HNZ51293.1 helix-turn-helix domain-containing protein [bacterium]HOH85663.1 helix-turn-helix domain-containing protein [bacterium]HOQ91604.1 helix-turn-helix domain-containing protein [bacterium]HPL22623.1 helix-turn-helix domain-containing protein [bacterium]